MHSEVLTLYDAVRRGARVSKNGPMLGYRKKQEDGSEPYVWIHYDAALKRADHVGMAFRELGLPVGQKCFIGIYSKNRPEWVIVEQAAYNYNNVLVPLYDTLGPAACSFIVNQAEIELVICDSIEKAMGLVKEREASPSLKTVVVFGDVPQDKIVEAESKGVRLLSYDEFEALGEKAKPIEHTPPKPDDLCTICYTSGTTGTPKGVMLTHGNVIADGTTLDLFKNMKVSISFE